MTALDQAFIKAYMHQDAAPVTASLSSAKPVRLAEALADPPKPEASELPSGQLSDSLAEAVAHALENPPMRARKEAVLRARPEPAEAARRPSGSPLWPTKSGPISKTIGTSPKAKPLTVQATRIAGTPAMEALGLPEGVLPVRQPSGESTAVAAEVPLPVAPISPPAGHDLPKARLFQEFRPAFQVDRFLWPTGCMRLSSAAGDQLDRLAEAITVQRMPSQGAVGVCGCRRGDGCTTLLLCVARRLAAQGLRIMLIDVDFDQPVLARRLGLLPDTGWEDVLWRGLPLAEAVIESVEDRLAVLPLRGAVPTETTGTVSELDPAGDMNVLRRQYDLVLLDLGRFDFSSHRATAVLQSARHWIDSVVVVHNVRTTPRTELDYVRRRLREAGLAEAGIAENFT